jgi:hypothetical protein
MKWPEKPCVNSLLFAENLRTVFLHYVAHLRSLIQFVDEEAVSLIHNFRGHIQALIPRLLGDHLHVITFALHTMHIFQALDRTMFRVFKK